MQELFLSQAFWAPENRGSLVKSPADLVVGTLREFAMRVPDPLPLALLMRNLGQDLFSPPNVKGWPGGDAWINSSTLLARKQFLERLLRVDETSEWRASFREREDLVPLVLLATPSLARASLDLRDIVADPVYQLK